MSDLHTDFRSISRLLGDAFEQLSQLVQTEIRLARAEVTEKAVRARLGVGLLFCGLILMVSALVLFLIALALFMAQQGMSPVVAHFLSGVIGAVLSALAIIAGLARLKPSSLAPDITIRQVQKDISAAKEIAR